MINPSRRLSIIVVGLAACLALAGCGGNAPYSPIISDTVTTSDLLLLTDTTTFAVEEGAVAAFPFVVKASGSFSSSVHVIPLELPTTSWELLPMKNFVPTTAGTQMTLKVNTSGVAPGNYTFKVRATGGGLTREAWFTLNVTGLEVSITPAQATATPTQPAVYTVTVTPVNGHNLSAVLDVTGLPEGIQATLTPGILEFPTPDSRTAQLVLAMQPAKRSRVPEGGTTFRVTATSGATSATDTAEVVISLTGGIDGIIR